jgi:hypothetical protein
MSEPRTAADRVEEVVPGVWSWSVHDDRIDFVSTAHAVGDGDEVVLIDPLPLASNALAELGDVTAICLRLRRELGARVYAPALSRQIEEEPDVRYSDGDELPGGLRAVFTPGAGTTQHTFLLEREGGVAFVPDLFTHVPERGLRTVWDEYMHDPAEARRSIEKLLELPFSVLCLDHGAPVTDDPKGAIRALLVSAS